MAKSSLKKEFFIKLKKSDNLTKDYQGCVINSIKNIIEFLSKKELDKNILMNIFDYDDRGTSNEKYLFNKLNNYLKDLGIPYKLYKLTYNHVQEVLTQLHQNIPVPMYFQMPIIEKIKDKFKYSGINFNFGNVWADWNEHILILLGYEDEGEIFVFIDPAYQLPYYDQKNILDKSKLIKLKLIDVIQHTKYIKTYMNVSINKQLLKNFRKLKEEKSPQKKLIKENGTRIAKS